MLKQDAHAVLFSKVSGKVLGAINGTVLPACAAERYHQVLESAREVFFHRVVDDAVYMGEEVLHRLLFVEESDDGFVHASELFVLVVAPRVMYGAAVEDKAASVSTGVFGKSLPV